jgi:hypothetical protein
VNVVGAAELRVVTNRADLLASLDPLADLDVATSQVGQEVDVAVVSWI